MSSLHTKIDVSKMTLDQKLEYIEILEAKKKLVKENFIDSMFPDSGPLSRAHYPAHMKFFEAGATHTHRLCMAANRTGKSNMCCFELVCHLSGNYPSWWMGKRLTKAVNWWVVGESTSLLRQSIIETLLGPVGEFGTGMIRKQDLDFETLTDTKKVSTTVESLRVKHKSGNFCRVDFKSFESGRQAFQAGTVNVLIDEQCPADVYSECLTRTLTLGENALTMLNFTPLKGVSEIITNFVEGHDYVTGEITSSKHLTNLTWADAPHLTEQAKADMLKMYPVYMRNARTLGLPMMGVGAVYPIDEERVFIAPLGFSIPPNWKRFAALDFGFIDPTAIGWFAIDPDSGVVYQYHEHYLSGQNVGVHALIIKAQNRLAGFDIPIAADPSGGGRSTANGDRTRQLYYEEYQIPMVSAENAIETGISRVFQYMIDGNFKVYNTCVHARAEFRSYSRTKNGFSGPDHMMDVWKYALATGRLIAKSKQESQPLREDVEDGAYPNFRGSADSWMM